MFSNKNQFINRNIVQGLQSNDKVICGFIGNIKGSFTEYDLFYSLDQGKTWQIQELKEKSYIRPNCLVNNILIFTAEKADSKKLFLNKALNILTIINNPSHKLLSEMGFYFIFAKTKPNPHEKSSSSFYSKQRKFRLQLETIHAGSGKVERNGSAC